MLNVYEPAVNRIRRRK